MWWDEEYDLSLIKVADWVWDMPNTLFSEFEEMLRKDNRNETYRSAFTHLYPFVDGQIGRTCPIGVRYYQWQRVPAYQPTLNALARFDNSAPNGQICSVEIAGESFVFVKASDLTQWVKPAEIVKKRQVLTCAITLENPLILQHNYPEPVNIYYWADQISETNLAGYDGIIFENTTNYKDHITGPGMFGSYDDDDFAFDCFQSAQEEQKRQVADHKNIVVFDPQRIQIQDRQFL